MTEAPTGRPRTWPNYIGFGIMALALAAAAFFVVELVTKKDDTARFERERRESKARTDALIESLDRDREFADVSARAAKTTVYQRRMDVFDGQCRGAGRPPFGFMVEGGTYAVNALVASRSACAPLGPGENRTNIYCCSNNKLADVVNPGQEP